MTIYGDILNLTVSERWTIDEYIVNALWTVSANGAESAWWTREKKMGKLNVSGAAVGGSAHK